MKERYSRKRINDQTQDPFQRDFIDLETARNIGMIVNVTESSEEEVDLLLKYADALKKRGKKVLIIEINFDKKAESQIKNALFINPTKLNWHDYPIPTMERKIQDYELDILMNFDPSPRLTSKYICGMARARTRTGIHEEEFESCYELMIEPLDREEGQEGNRMSTMIKEFDYFLNMIDNRHRMVDKV
jgi:hypothetical protein